MLMNTKSLLSANISKVFNHVIDTRLAMTASLRTDDSDVTEKLNDVFSDFIDLIAEHVHAVK